MIKNLLSSHKINYELFMVSSVTGAGLNKIISFIKQLKQQALANYH